MLGRPVLNHGSPKFLWQRVTPVVVGWFSDRAWKNPVSYCEFFTVFTRFTNVAASDRLETHVMPSAPARCILNFPRNQWCRINTKI